MTVASPIAKAGPFLDDGTTAVYPFTLQVSQASDVKLIRTTKVGSLYSDAVLSFGVDYTVALNPDQVATPGGTVTTLANDAGTYLTVVRDVQYTQGVSIPNQGGFYPEVLEGALDKLTMLVQQIRTDISRSLLLSYADEETSLQTLVENIASAGSAAQGSADAAAASAVNSAASADASEASAVESSASASLAQAWATQTGTEVELGEGYSAKQYAQNAAASANAAAASSGVPLVSSATKNKALLNDGTATQWANALRPFTHALRTAPFTAELGTVEPIDPAAGCTSVNGPSSPVEGDYFEIHDVSSGADAHPVTLYAGTVNGVPAAFVIDIAGLGLNFTWLGETWVASIVRRYK